MLPVPVPSCPAISALPSSIVDYGPDAITVTCRWGYTFSDGTRLRTFICLRDVNSTVPRAYWHSRPVGCEIGTDIAGASSICALNTRMCLMPVYSHANMLIC